MYFFLVSGGYLKSHYFLQPSKYWKYDQHHLFPVILNEFIYYTNSCNKHIHVINEFINKIENFNIFFNTI